MFKLPSETVWQKWAPLPLRLIVGYGFLAHGFSWPCPTRGFACFSSSCS